MPTTIMLRSVGRTLYLRLTRTSPIPVAVRHRRQAADLGIGIHMLVGHRDLETDARSIRNSCRTSRCASCGSGWHSNLPASESCCLDWKTGAPPSPTAPPSACSCKSRSPSAAGHRDLLLRSDHDEAAHGAARGLNRAGGRTPDPAKTPPRERTRARRARERNIMDLTMVEVMALEKQWVFQPPLCALRLS